jgi:Leucine-rich repeat (LRR) protein
MNIEILGKIYNVECEVLDLTSKNIKHIPVSIGNLTNLKELDLYRNKINTLPDSIGNLINLHKLNLSYNQINNLPDSIGNLINLQILSICYNQINTLPDSIANLINLQELYLHNNKITILPYEILKIKKALVIDETSYEINNLNVETEILIFSDLKTELTNLPVGLKEIWINKFLKVTNIKLPFGCKIKRY